MHKDDIKIYFILGIIGVIYLYFLFSSDEAEKKASQIKAKSWREHFDSAEIAGTITYVSHKPVNGDAFSTSDNPSDVYYCLVNFKPPYSDREFKYFAKIGDSIIKHQFSDTLILVSNGVKYYCSFPH
jgi:hypothetical protein